MRTYILSLIIIFFCISSNAADVNVDATGAVAGSHTTITAAIAAASDGDRIVVFSNGIIYHESFTINKSLTFLSSAPEEYFFVEGNITVTPAVGRIITIVGLSIQGYVYSGADNSVGTRCTVSIIDSRILGEVDFSNAGFDVNVLYSEINYSVRITHGKIIANTIGIEDLISSIYGEIEIVTESASFGGVGDTVFIIANKITKGNNSSNYYPLTFDNANARYFIANNAIRNGISTSSGSSYFRTTVRITNCYTAGSNNLFMNNYVTGYDSGSGCTGSSTAALVELIGISDDNIINNLFRNRYGSTYGCALLGQRGDYNVYYNFRDYPWAVDNNITNETLVIDLVSGEITDGDGIDEGKPGASYLDLDLSRNDVSVYGGPYSWENYWENTENATGRSRVYLLDIPSNIYSITTPTIIKASSTHLK